MEFFIEQLRLVLPVLGLDFLHETPKPSSEWCVLHDMARPPSIVSGTFSADNP